MGCFVFDAQTSMAKALATLSLAAAIVAQAQPTFRVRADLVQVDVVVAVLFTSGDHSTLVTAIPWS